MTTTNETTAARIDQLRTEAAVHGDDLQWCICSIALGDDVVSESPPAQRLSVDAAARLRTYSQESAWEACEEAIADAAAQ